MRRGSDNRPTGERGFDPAMPETAQSLLLEAEIAAAEANLRPVTVPPGPVLLRWALLVPFLLWLAIIAGALLGRPPTAPIELESLAAAWHMWQDGSWLPQRGGEGLGNLAPLHLWAILAGWHLFGLGDLWPRLLSVLASLGTLYLVGRSALQLWPHRTLTELYARILLIGTIAFALIATMVQPEPLVLLVTALGFHALSHLWQVTPRQIGYFFWWGVFALSLMASFFTLGSAALLLLPLAALLPPYLSEGIGPQLTTGMVTGGMATGGNMEGGQRLGLRFVPHWHLSLLIAIVPALLGWFAWQATLAGAGIEASFLGFGSGWNAPATEAGRREIWSLLLVPLLLYPWICWKTLWRALARQMRTAMGRGFRLCLAYLLASIVAGIATGWQMQGLVYAVLPLSLLGARLLATQEIRARDFHAIVPALWALLLGLCFFLMNIIPTAHLDVLWRALFDVSLPIWIGGMGMTSGLVLLVAGYGIAQLSPMQLLSRTIQVATLPVLLLTCINIEFPFNLRQFFDLTPVAERLRELQDAGQPLAVYGPYRGEFDFYGRLGAAPVSLPDEAAAMAWAKAHPAGVIVSYFDGSPLRLPTLPYYRGVARDRWVAVWPASAVLATQGAALNQNF
ncbi:ArnT family glycosyltransferase [Dongia sp.]|uniref:ArnT family glycosyltransferase n=1 Tax=Dongia sp. TaxID=1977262 RepID=UPI0035B2E3D4